MFRILQSIDAVKEKNAVANQKILNARRMYGRTQFALPTTQKLGNYLQL